MGSVAFFLLNEGETGRCFLQSAAVTNASTIRNRTFGRLSSIGTESVNMDNTSGGATFPLSTSLLAELRRSVWIFLCPEIGARPLVLLLRPTATEVISLDSLLSGTTSTMRTVLAVHQDSRQLALEALDTLRLRNGEVLIRFREKKDVILLWGCCSDKPAPEGPLVRSLSDTVVNLAMQPDPLHVQRLQLYRSLPGLKILYELFNFPVIIQRRSTDFLAWRK